MPAPFAPDNSVPAVAARQLVLAAIRGYQLLFSQLFAGSCRFLPSCSAYATEAVERHGVIKGGFLAVRRLGRCHPFCAGGHDPVPLD
ncbi:MAG TPA: membrane protein insertion efficiency factor YidD [Vicinamibacterales bacterium]|nr:membrane protein insertion efficiency factor YidD [Vicinamibacterales bacterium]